MKMVTVVLTDENQIELREVEVPEDAVGFRLIVEGVAYDHVSTRDHDGMWVYAPNKR